MRILNLFSGIKLGMATALALLIVLTVPLFVSALTVYEKPPAPSFTTFGQFVTNVLGKLLGWTLTLLIALAAIYIILAAFAFLTSDGSEEKIQVARRRLIYAAVAIAIALSATSVEFVVRALVDSDADTTPTEYQSEMGPAFPYPGGPQ